MNPSKFLVAVFAALCGTLSYGQTHYQKIEVGTVLQSGISLGIFTKPIPLPDGNWVVISKRIDEIKLTGGSRNSVPKVVLTLKNANASTNLLFAMVMEFTPDSHPINWTHSKCASEDKNAFINDFDRTPSSLVYICSKTFVTSNFKSRIASSTSAWIKSNVSMFSGFPEGIPDDVVWISLNGSQHLGKNIAYSFFIKREGDPNADTAYAEHIKRWAHAAGLSLEKVLTGDNTRFDLPVAYTGGVNLRATSTRTENPTPAAPQQSPTIPPNPSVSKQPEQRLIELKALLEKGLISKDQYEKKSSEIINGL